MSNCQDEGATHHTGCDCWEARWKEEVARLRESLDAAHEKNVQWARAVGTLAGERAELRDRIGVLADRLERGARELRDAWKAEDRVRSVLRRLWAEVNDEDRCQRSGHMISQPLWEEVEATLKEAEEI